MPFILVAAGCPKHAPPKVVASVAVPAALTQSSVDAPTIVYSIGGLPNSGKALFFLPANLTGDYVLVDLLTGQVDIKATIWVDPVTGGMIIDTDDFRLGVR